MISSSSKDGANINQRQVLPARAGSWGTLRLTDGDFRPSGGKIDTKNDSMSLWSHDDILDVRGLNPRLGPLFCGRRHRILLSATPNAEPGAFSCSANQNYK